MRIRFATGWADRLIGLLPQGRSLEGDEVLMIVPCHDIHTFGMRRAIDIAFLDRRGIVLRTYSGLPPGKRLRCLGAVCVLERLSPSPACRGEVPASAAEKDGFWFHTGEVVRIGSAEGPVEFKMLDVDAPRQVREKTGEEGIWVLDERNRVVSLDSDDAMRPGGKLE